MPDETELRRPEFEDGTPVVLADGREWTLAKPRVRWVPDGSDRGCKVVLSRPDGGAFSRLTAEYDALWATGEPVAYHDLARVELGLGRALLLANYDLTDEQVGGLLQFSYDREGDPEGARIREEVTDVAFGVGPKPSAAGGGSPSSPTA
jgi:hypothetical protein